MDDSLESYKKAVIDVFNSQYAHLSSALQGCMTKFTEEAFDSSLISESVMSSENFADITNSSLCSSIEVDEDCRGDTRILSLSPL